MNFIAKLTAKTLKSIADYIEDQQTPPSFKTGEKFEEFVRNTLFPKDKYTLVERTHSYKDNNDDYVESSLKPDFKFRCRKTSQEFYVEAKYRKGTYQGKYEWCKPYQLKRYKAIKDIPVFVVLGIAGSPDRPELVAMMPLEVIQYPALFPSFVEKYIVDHHQGLILTNA